MNYQEAIDFKRGIGSDEISEGGFNMKILIAPELRQDFNNYIQDYPDNKFNDQSAKMYSSNNKFKVIGVHYNGVDLYHKDLTV